MKKFMNSRRNSGRRTVHAYEGPLALSKTEISRTDNVVLNKLDLDRLASVDTFNEYARLCREINDE